MRTTKSFSITVPKELATAIDRVAKGQGRSRSSYLAWLIRKDAPNFWLELRPPER
jgi:metal-responsive CopG/Arc/MetJ family transcriptional regulator